MPNDNFVDYSGQSIGDYHIEKVLSRHSISIRYLAKDRSDMPVVIEILNKTAEQDPEGNGRFRQHIHTLMKHPHSGIATILHVGQTAESHAYAVSQHIAGTTLSQKLADWHQEGAILPVIGALQMIKHLAQTLAVFHSLAILHYDLTPDNIILDQNNMLVLLGLGVLYQTEPPPPIRQVAVLDYISPEQQQGKPINGRSNMYSLGIILYELLAGHRPEIPITDWDIFEITSLPKEVPLEKVRPGLTAVTYQLVNTCLWRQEWNRYETMNAFVGAIDDAIAVEIAPDKPARVPRWIYVAAPLALLLLVLVGFALARGQSEPEVLTATAVPTIAPFFQTPFLDEAVTPAIQTTANRDNPVQSTPDDGPQILTLNPTSGQLFTNDEIIIFGWSYPIPLTSDQQFLLELKTERGTQILGTVTKPLADLHYRFTINLADWESLTGSHQWVVVLESVSSGQELLRSDPQPFKVQTIVLVTTPTPKVTSTPTFTPTLTPEITTEEPTPTAVCTPMPPAGWVLYAIQEGDYLFNLGLATGVTFERIMEVNCVTATSLSVGQQLWLPFIPATETPTATPTSTATAESAPSGSSSGSNPPPSQPSETDTPEPVKTPPPLPTNSP